MTDTGDNEKQLFEAIRKFIAEGGTRDEAVAMICSAYCLTAIPPAGSGERERRLRKLRLKAKGKR